MLHMSPTDAGFPAAVSLTTYSYAHVDGRHGDLLMRTSL